MNLNDSIFFIIGTTIILLVVAIQQIQADEMVHEFKNPSFSGVGTSSHYLTIENQETNRKQAIKRKCYVKLFQGVYQVWKQWEKGIQISIKSSTIWTSYWNSVKSVALCTIRRISTTFVPMFGNSTVRNNRANDIVIIGKIS